MSETRTLKLWQESPDGKRIPVIITTDARLTIKTVTIAGTETALASMGTFVGDPFGAQVATPSPLMARLVKFFVPSEPCWFQGCEEMREKFAADIAALEKAAADAGTVCRDCDKGVVQARYLAILRDMGV